MADSPLKLVHAPASEPLIKLLEELLEDVKAGNVVGASMAWVKSDGTTASAFGGTRLATQLGALSLLQNRVIRFLDD